MTPDMHEGVWPALATDVSAATPEADPAREWPPSPASVTTVATLAPAVEDETAAQPAGEPTPERDDHAVMADEPAAETTAFADLVSPPAPDAEPTVPEIAPAIDDASADPEPTGDLEVMRWTDAPAEAPADVEPAIEPPVAETPVVEAPVVETPVAEAPVVETPSNDDACLADFLPAVPDYFDAADLDGLDSDIDAAELGHLPLVEHAPFGGSNLAAVRASTPRVLAAYQELEAAVMAPTPGLSERDRALVGLAVALETRSGYWQAHLRHRLQRWTDLVEIDAIMEDWPIADLPVRDRAMLAFAVKLTVVPGQMSEQDAALLGNIGFSERDLIDLVDVVSYWCFATRVVEGLGVYLEPGVALHPALA